MKGNNGKREEREGEGGRGGREEREEGEGGRGGREEREGGEGKPTHLKVRTLNNAIVLHLRPPQGEVCLVLVGILDGRNRYANGCPPQCRAFA